MSSKLLDAHIEVNPGFAGGQPHIAGHRIKVRDIAVWHEQLGMSADQIGAEYDLDLVEIYSALALLFGIARAAQEAPNPAPWPLRDADRPLFLKLSLLAYRNSGVFGLMVRDPGLPRRLQEAANRFDNTCAEKGEAQALKDLSGSILVEHQVVLEAARDPVFWRILATKPEFPQDPSRVAAALRWYGAGAQEHGNTPA